MVTTRPISKTITSLLDVENQFHLHPTTDDHFFPEWLEDLPQPSSQQKATLDQIRHRFYRHRQRGSLTEGTINQLLVSPLLTLAGLFDEPFLVSAEQQVELAVEENDELLRGRIDTLIIAGQLWVLVVESKSTLTYAAALPQALTYMMANPNPGRSVYGLLTNGDEFQFVKLKAGDHPQYDLSAVFSLLLPRRNQLISVFAILENIRQIMLTGVE